MSSSDRSIDELREKKEKDLSFIHVRVTSDLKRDLVEHTKKENSSITAVVTSLLENFLYKKDEDEEDEEQDQILETIVNSLMNLERRMEIRLATLQDTFNSLIGRLIDSQQNITSFRSSQLHKRKGEANNEEAQLDLTDILDVDKEEEIYRRVKRFLQQQGKVIDANTVLQQLEVDRSIKNFLEEQEKSSPGWKIALVTDAIQEAAYDLGYPMFDSI